MRCAVVLDTVNGAGMLGEDGHEHPFALSGQTADALVKELSHRRIDVQELGDKLQLSRSELVMLSRRCCNTQYLTDEYAQRDIEAECHTFQPPVQRWCNDGRSGAFPQWVEQHTLLPGGIDGSTELLLCCQYQSLVTDGIRYFTAGLALGDVTRIVHGTGRE